MRACLDACNFVHVFPMLMYDMSKCSSHSALHDGLVCIHVPVHIDALIIVAKMLCDINC